MLSSSSRYSFPTIGFTHDLSLLIKLSFIRWGIGLNSKTDVRHSATSPSFRYAKEFCYLREALDVLKYTSESVVWREKHMCKGIRNVLIWFHIALAFNSRLTPLGRQAFFCCRGPFKTPPGYRYGPGRTNSNPYEPPTSTSTATKSPSPQPSQTTSNPYSEVTKPAKSGHWANGRNNGAAAFSGAMTWIRPSCNHLTTSGKTGYSLLNA